MSKEQIFNVSVSLIGGGISYLLGGFDGLIETLGVLMIVDIVSKFPSIWNDYSSSEMSRGLIKKAMTFVAIVVLVEMDRMTGNSQQIFRNTGCLFFISNEGLSVVENLGEYIELPAFLEKFLRALHDENDDKEVIK